MFSALCISGFLQFLQTAVFTVGYISGVQLFPEPLSSEEERLYLEKLSTGDEDSRNILIERNLRLVAHVCKKYANSNVDQDDLISIGTIGLIKGINSFKPEKGARLSTYVSRCIDKRILSCWNQGGYKKIRSFLCLINLFLQFRHPTLLIQ